ncbi:alanine/glycine:cation symporter family protein [Thermohalobacter berrensis]|uniref:alanine/glycine:cation symporter family protein n=1 Tax=Thermohalobacter berrensis TaxID=99594 RepID=UPI00242AD832|nr:alanine/glycine:cation symporter family protein [Thermohalobacter berrensis]
MQKIIDIANTLLWSYILIALLIILGIYFTIKTNFAQFRFIKEMFRLLGDSTSSISSNEKDGVSSFQAFCISTASRVGTGNLAGVAIAISLGGPGAVFWMWLIALIGAASSFVESTLAQIYKVKDKYGYRGGPAYYMEKGLNKKWMGVLFSVLITLCFGLVFNSVQANTITLAFKEAFGIDRLVMGLCLTIITGLVIFGGVKRIARVAELIVPIMALAYILVALFVVFKNISSLPEVFSIIISNAFGLKEAVGGGIGSAIMMGIKRGLFSNEAGMGSAPNAAATAEVSHPVKQGLIQTLGVFTDTLLICSATAFIIILSGNYTAEGLTGIQLTQISLSNHVGQWAEMFIAICILLFAFSSIIGNYYYGETNIEFMNSNKALMFLYRVAVLGMVIFGSIAKIKIVWSMADLFMGLMALTNLIAISMLGKIAFKALNDYSSQRNIGKEPVFFTSNIQGLKNTDCWNRSQKMKNIA